MPRAQFDECKCGDNLLAWRCQARSLSMIVTKVQGGDFIMNNLDTFNLIVTQVNMLLELSGVMDDIRI